MTARTILLISGFCFVLTGCGGGSNNPSQVDGNPATFEDGMTDSPPVTTDNEEMAGEGGQSGENASGDGEPVVSQSGEVDPGDSDPIDGQSGEPVLPAFGADTAGYRVTLENEWGVEDFPQGFPDDAHLSLIAGATHNEAVLFWEIGEPATRGIEDMAEAGLIDIFLSDEVVPAIESGTANSQFSVREYTDAKIGGVSGTLSFKLQIRRDYPLVTLVTMLGPSPDWFVGVSGQRLYDDNEGWPASLQVDLPLLDGGTKSDITPIMGGPDIIPGEPIGYVAYDVATGTYLPSDTPQNVARLRFERIE